MYYSLVLCLFALAIVHANVIPNQQEIQPAEHQGIGLLGNMEAGGENKARSKKEVCPGTPFGHGLASMHGAGCCPKICPKPPCCCHQPRPCPGLMRMPCGCGSHMGQNF